MLAEFGALTYIMLLAGFSVHDADLGPSTVLPFPGVGHCVHCGQRAVLAEGAGGGSYFHPTVLVLAAPPGRWSRLPGEFKGLVAVHFRIFQRRNLFT